MKMRRRYIAQARLRLMKVAAVSRSFTEEVCFWPGYELIILFLLYDLFEFGFSLSESFRCLRILRGLYSGQVP